LEETDGKTTKPSTSGFSMMNDIVIGPVSVGTTSTSQVKEVVHSTGSTTVKNDQEAEQKIK